MSQSRLTSGKGSKLQRFNVNRHLEGLKGEFEMMAQEIESLRKERDGYKAKVETQTKELQDFRRYVVCGQCRKGATSTPQIIASPQLRSSKATISVSSRTIPQSGLPEEPSGFGISRRVDPSQQSTTGRSTQHGTLIQGSHPTQDSDSIDPHSRSVSSPSPSEPSLSALGPDSPKEQNQSIIFNSDAEKELDVEMIHVLSHIATIETVKFSRDGKYLAAGCHDGKAYIYDAESGTLTCILRNLFAEKDRTTAVCFSQDGKHLATASSDTNVYIWQIKTKFLRNVFRGHDLGILSLDFSPNGRLLVSASHDNTVRLWDMRYGAARVLLGGNLAYYAFLSAIFSPDGMYVAASHGDGTVRIWDVRVGQLMRKMKSNIDWVYDVAFMPDGKGLMSGGYDKKLRYWDVSSLYTNRFQRSQTKDVSHIFLSGVEEQSHPEREFLGHTRFVYSLSISPDGRWVASGSLDRSVRIWDTRNAAMQCILDHDNMVFTVDFSSAGRFLASGDEFGVLKIWRYSDTRLGRKDI